VPALIAFVFAVFACVNAGVAMFACVNAACATVLAALAVTCELFAVNQESDAVETAVLAAP
jgi:hypothetical protein